MSWSQRGPRALPSLSRFVLHQHQQNISGGPPGRALQSTDEPLMKQSVVPAPSSLKHSQRSFLGHPPTTSTHQQCSHYVKNHTKDQVKVGDVISVSLSSKGGPQGSSKNATRASHTRGLGFQALGVLQLNFVRQREAPECFKARPAND